MRVAARLLHLDDLVVDLRVATGEERAAVDHHVDLVGAQLDRRAHVRDLQRRRVLARREAGRDRRDLHAAAAEPLAHRGHEVRIDADRGDRTERSGSDGSGRIAFEAIAAALPGVSAPSSVVRSVVRIASCERPDLRVALDRALRERRRALLERDRVDGADPRQPRLERQLEPRRQCRRLGHALSLVPAKSSQFAAETGATLVAC